MYTHTNGRWAEVTRFAETTEVYTRFDHGGEQRRIVSYTLDNEVAAMGFTIDVDALHFTVSSLDIEALRRRIDWSSAWALDSLILTSKARSRLKRNAKSRAS